MRSTVTDLMKLCTDCSKIKKKSRSKSQKNAQLIESLPETQQALSPTWSVVATPKIPAFGGMKQETQKFKIIFLESRRLAWTMRPC